MLIVSFFFFIYQFFSFFYFYHVKHGVTPLFVAAFKGHEQIVEILLEKGEPNVDLAIEVILLIISFSFFLFLFHFLIFFIFLSKGWNNSSLYCCSKRI